MVFDNASHVSNYFSIEMKMILKEKIQSDISGSVVLIHAATAAVFAESICVEIERPCDAPLAGIDGAILNRADALLYNDPGNTREDPARHQHGCVLCGQHGQERLADNNFDVAHVLSGEINARGRATGYHAELAADGAARITSGATVKQRVLLSTRSQNHEQQTSGLDG
ncbi:hypothetical protein [Variovorax sp. KK3]|uniref:hypothetical protein n=1 Tax=Variovorax sp. KK3 TaxID=1855728 RepID=UPI00117C59B2|nr:hypothetical protein [Variovorax sp. KK3]